MRGAALVRIPNPFAKSEATPPRPFCRSRLRLCFAEPAGGAGLVSSRPPYTLVLEPPIVLVREM